MNTNIFSQAPSPDAIPTEPRGLIIGAIATFLLAVRQYLKRKCAARADAISRAEVCAEMRAMSDRIHADHLALLEKLDKNHWDLLAVLERQAGRINALEAGLARVDERTRREA
jgi:hypothetical protein